VVHRGQSFVPNDSDKSDSKWSRRFPRYPIDVKLSVYVFRSGENVSYWGRSNELGEDGIGATLTGTLESGEVVAMELMLPMAPFPIKFRALVRYRDGLRHGFEFLALTGTQRDEIRRVCEMLATTL
jgi:PilZ domain